MKFLSTDEAAKKLGKAIGTLANWRMIGKGPRFIKVGWGIIYDPVEVDKFIKEQNNERAANKSRKSRGSLPRKDK